MNKYVYLIMSGRDEGRVLGVVTTPERATMLVNTNAAINYGMNITKADCPPLDYNGVRDMVGRVVLGGRRKRCWYDWGRVIVPFVHFDERPGRFYPGANL